MQNKEIDAYILAKQKAKCKSEAIAGCGAEIQIPTPRTLPFCEQLPDLPQCYNYGHMNDKTPTSSEMFFKAPQKHQPFEFDYLKILGFQTRNNAQGKHIKRTFLQALGMDVEKLSELKEAQLELKQAISECIDKMLRKSKPVEDKENDWPLEQYPKYAHYDPNDAALMDRMLRDAFQHLKKNPKFVWAQLPDAHKLPMLREWIWQRFGKVYTSKERYASYRKSIKLFNALDGQKFKVRQPRNNDVADQQTFKANCHGYVEQKVKVINGKYLNKLDDGLLEQSRTLWFAMRPYLCAGGPPNGTYFAYKPSQPGDTQWWRTWKPTEFRDNRAAWRKRQIRN